MSKKRRVKVEVEPVEGLPDYTTQPRKSFLKELAVECDKSPGKWFRAKNPNSGFPCPKYYRERGYKVHQRTLDGVKYVYMSLESDDEK